MPIWFLCMDIKCIDIFRRGFSSQTSQISIGGPSDVNPAPHSSEVGSEGVKLLCGRGKAVVVLVVPGVFN